MFLDAEALSMGSSSNLKNLVESKLSSIGGGETSVSEEILSTFTTELAHTAYLSICRLNSG